VPIKKLAQSISKASKNLYSIKVENNTTQMFAVLPTSTDFCKDDAEWYTNLDQAYDVAFDWSVQLSGDRVNIYEVYRGKFIKLTEVFA